MKRKSPLGDDYFIITDVQTPKEHRKIVRLLRWAYTKHKPEIERKIRESVLNWILYGY